MLGLCGNQSVALPIRWGLSQVWRQLLHTDWVCQLQYISELNSILSCSLDKRLCLADVEARVTVKYLEGHTQGVRAVDWSKAYSFIASGGLDRNVMLWNPFQLQSMATLQVSSSFSKQQRNVVSVAYKLNRDNNSLMLADVAYKHFGSRGISVKPELYCNASTLCSA